MIVSQTELAEILVISNLIVSSLETVKSFPTIKIKRKLKSTKARICPVQIRSIYGSFNCLFLFTFLCLKSLEFQIYL